LAKSYSFIKHHIAETSSNEASNLEVADQAVTWAWHVNTVCKIHTIIYNASLIPLRQSIFIK